MVVQAVRDAGEDVFVPHRQHERTLRQQVLDRRRVVLLLLLQHLDDNVLAIEL